MWKDILGYEGRYQISDLGEIKSLAKTSLRSRNRIRTGKDKVLNPYPNPKGYLLIDLSTKTMQVHRIVAMTFIDNPLNLPQVNHKDGNKSNNKIDNLEWITNMDNMRHSWNVGLRDKMRTKLSHKVNQINIETGEIIKVWNSIKETRRAGFGSVEKVVSDKYPHFKTCKGYKWETV